MIIDCHGHYTTAPAAHRDFREAQLAWLADRSRPGPEPARIPDDDIRLSIEDNQLRIMRERGTDLMIISPQASAMGHHVTDPAVAAAWARASNDLIARLTAMYPGQFAAVCQLPQTPGGSLEPAIAELRRCVDELGFVGCNLNPDPSGGHWTGEPLTDPSWFPLFEAMTELDVPAMIHVSASCAPGCDTLGAHYLNADTAVFMQLVSSDLFARFPALRFVIPHGGGAVPYHWGRFRGLAERMGRPAALDHVLGNVFFDTCVYHQPGIELLLRVMGPGNVLFASELLGAVRGVNPETGHSWDDTKRYLDALDLGLAERSSIFEANVRRVYPRLDARLGAPGRQERLRA
jgi:4-oxalmesaconate hydratase